MSAANRQFSLALEAMAELKAEASASDVSPHPLPATPSLSAVLADIGALPREALFLGIASDGLPVLLNLHDSLPGPILITGDASSGKTIFLKTIVRSLIQIHNPADVQFGVITNHPEEWENVPDTPHCAGIFSMYDTSTHDLLLSLASWAHANKNPRQSILLLIDDLESAAGLSTEALQNLRWLLLRGPARRVWPIITLSSQQYEPVISWLQNFRTRIFCRIANESAAEALGADKLSGVDRLEAQIQFSLRENGSWLQFWLPSC